MKEYLFSYGTLQKEKVQMELFGKILPGSTDLLKGYKISIIEIRDPAFLSRGEERYQQTLAPSVNPSDQVRGTVFEVSAQELLLTDRYEPDNYKRILVTLHSGIRAWIYVGDSYLRPAQTDR